MKSTAVFLLSLTAIAALSFFLVARLPGDAALNSMLPMGVTDTAVIENLRQSLGLDLSLPLRFINWLKGVMQLDFGQSFYYARAVSSVLADASSVTVKVCTLAVFMILILALPLGFYCALKPDGIIDKILQKGEESDTGKRIAVALTAIQKLGIEVPAPIFNFSQCQLRLQAAVDSLNEALKQIKDKMLEILPIGAKAMPPYLTLLSTLRSSSDLFKDGVNTVTSKLVMLKSALLTYRETASTDNDSCFLISKFLENIKQDPEDAVTPQAICESSVPDLKEIREQMIELKNSPSTDDVSQKEHLFSEYRNKLLQFYESECDRYINLIGSLKHKEPLDFCDCMGEVISQNMRSSLSRLGFFTALRYTYS